MSRSLAIEGCYLATVDADDREYPSGHLVFGDGRLLAVGSGRVPEHHHFVYGNGDLLGATIAEASTAGLRFHPSQRSMNLGESAGGLPPDCLIERHDEILVATEAEIERFHDPAPNSMVRIGVALCSPFSVTPELMRDSAELARQHGVRLPTHLAEIADEFEFCFDKYGKSPVDYADELGWLGPDVWLAHGVHLSSSDIARLAGSGTSLAHCPTSKGRLGSGIAPAGAAGRRCPGRARGGRCCIQRIRPAVARAALGCWPRYTGAVPPRSVAARRWPWRPGAGPAASADQLARGRQAGRPCTVGLTDLAGPVSRIRSRPWRSARRGCADFTSRAVRWSSTVACTPPTSASWPRPPAVPVAA